MVPSSLLRPPVNGETRLPLPLKPSNCGGGEEQIKQLYHGNPYHRTPCPGLPNTSTVLNVLKQVASVGSRIPGIGQCAICHVRYRHSKVPRLGKKGGEKDSQG